MPTFHHFTFNQYSTLPVLTFWEWRSVNWIHKQFKTSFIPHLTFKLYTQKLCIHVRVTTNQFGNNQEMYLNKKKNFKITLMLDTLEATTFTSRHEISSYCCCCDISSSSWYAILQNLSWWQTPFWDGSACSSFLRFRLLIRFLMYLK